MTRKPATATTTATAVVGALSLLAAVTGCGKGGDAAAGDPKQLTVLSQYLKSTPGGKVFYDEVAAFSAESGIKVKIVEAGEDLDESYETSLAANKEADVVFVNLYDKTLAWTKNNATVPVDKYLDDWGLRGKAEPQALKEWTNPEGKAMGFPFAGFSWPVWYNTALLKKAGVDEIPTTSDELIDAAEKLRKEGIQPMAVGGNDWSGQKLFLQISQSYVSKEAARKLDAEGGYCDSDGAMKGIELFTELRDAGVFADKAQGFTFDAMQNQYYTGKAAIMSQGSWAFSEVPEKVRANTKLAGLPLPKGAAFDKPTVFTGYTSTGFWISPNGDKKQDAVKRFVRHFYRPEVAGHFVAEASIYPGVKLDAEHRKSDDPLLNSAINDIPRTTADAQLPDLHIPAAANTPLVQATSLAFGPGHDAEKICGALDQAYAGAK
ncbi:ABC transporter substrate-binding protein [Streptomyces sp. PA5.6]|uniref:ABC transporter substrate-binding protein n=1 Tax=Streptomyces sp. PA5.6 TaxID=3035651 RepID=UPI0039047D52